MKAALPFLVVAVAATLAVKHHRTRAAEAAALPARETGGVGLALERKNGRYLVHALVPGTPAARSHMIEVGDELVAVRSAGHREVKVAQLEFELVVDLIRGEPGEEIELCLKQPRHASPVRILLRRESLRVED